MWGRGWEGARIVKKVEHVKISISREPLMSIFRLVLLPSGPSLLPARKCGAVAYTRAVFR
eukprot:359878-Chlamydomonas_euryale.AAC.2